MAFLRTGFFICAVFVPTRRRDGGMPLGKDSGVLDFLSGLLGAHSSSLTDSLVPDVLVSLISRSSDI